VPVGKVAGNCNLINASNAAAILTPNSFPLMVFKKKSM